MAISCSPPSQPSGWRLTMSSATISCACWRWLEPCSRSPARSASTPRSTSSSMRSYSMVSRRAGPTVSTAAVTYRERTLCMGGALRSVGRGRGSARGREGGELARQPGRLRVQAREGDLEGRVGALERLPTQGEPAVPVLDLLAEIGDEALLTGDLARQ